MESPLLEEVSSSADDHSPARSFKEVKSVFWVETVKLWRITGPIAFQILCYYGISTITTIFVGHIGAVELSAVSIALSVVGTFSFGFLLGMGSALETLCGQAVGAGKIQMLGIYLQRSWIILSVTCVFLSPIYIFATPILKLLGQEEQISKLAGKFTIATLPQLFSLAISFPTQKFLQSQSKVMVLAWMGFAALLVHALILWLFIDVFDWGAIGAAIAYDVINLGIAIAQVTYIIGWCGEAWRGFSWLAFKDLWAFVKLSVASAVMLCLEVWYFMSIIILTGHLNNAVIAVGALSICVNLEGAEAMLFLGLNAAISVRVSNELGLRHPRTAKYAVYVAVFQSLVVGLLFMVAVIIARKYLGVIFTNSKELQDGVANLAYLLAITMLLNSVQPVLSGVAIGGGWQGLVAYINLGCYYVFGLPLGFLLGYTANMGVAGVWGGMIAGTALQTLLLVIIVAITNWDKEVEQTTDRMRKWGGQDIDAAADGTSPFERIKY